MALRYAQSPDRSRPRLSCHVPLTAADTIEILDLIGRYCHAVDAGDGPAYADTYLPEGIFEMPVGLVEGRDALIEMVGVIQNAMPGVRHMSSNWVIEGDGDAATMRCYMQIKVHDPASGERAPPQPKLVATGIYDDTLRRVDGAWKFASRKINVECWDWPDWP